MCAENDHASGEKNGGRDDIMSGKTKGSIAVNGARYMARNPWKCLIGSFLTAMVLSVSGLVGGKFKIAVENDGWMSRTTLIANRHIQYKMIEDNQVDLFNDQDGIWNHLQRNKKSGWDYGFGRRLTDVENGVQNTRKMPEEHLSTECGKWHAQENYNGDDLLCVWKSQKELSAFDPKVLLEICEAEQNTLSLMKSIEVCMECDGKCIPPYSLVAILRHYLSSSVNNTSQMDCEDLISEYSSSVQTKFTAMLAGCVDILIEMVDSGLEDSSNENNNRTSCPYLSDQIAALVEKSFGVDHQKMQYTSSRFPTVAQKIDDLYDVVDKMDRGDSSIVRGAYDTANKYFGEKTVDTYIETDMLLAIGSFLITTVAMLVHTRSPWLTSIGIIQIIFSIPLAYFVYYFFAQLRFFPFLNFIGVFVAAALGADDVFVAVDKWKNARRDNPSASTETIASIALPDAAGAMLLTTSTTCAAFFATAICQVAPIRCFAIFCGLLIFFDYTMNVALIFPALCLYDSWLMNEKSNCCVSICTKRDNKIESEQIEDDMHGADNKSMIHTILTSYYKYLHKFRWVVMGIFIISLGVCIYISTTFKLPESSEVRLLPESHQFELNFTWKNMLLASELFTGSGSSVAIVWGLKAEDNGNKNDPNSLSSLVLDDSFNPRSTQSQIFLRDMCSDLFENEFAQLPNEDYECPINGFESWLREQANSTSSSAYLNYCGNANGLPMSSDAFDACFIGWSQEHQNMDVLAEDGKIKVLILYVKSTAYFADPYSVLKREYNNFENWLSSQRKAAPNGVNAMYHTSSTFWFYDTNRAMLQTAIGAAGIAIAFSSVIVLIASRSFPLTLFSTVSIVYVLTATTSCLIGLGYSLGFLESICLAILIGISCDFVIHFSHAYKYFPGERSRTDRTKHTVLHMGPSILAAAATTFSAAAIMLFCKIQFFTKFASVLFFTMLHSTIGTFVGFLVMVDLFGPSNPTKFVDKQLDKCFGKAKRESELPKD